MRLFLYLIALVAGFSPAQASRVALSEPVAVGTVSASVEARASYGVAAAQHHQHLVAHSIGAHPAFTVRLHPAPQAFGAATILSDRPRT